MCQLSVREEGHSRHSCSLQVLDSQVGGQVTPSPGLSKVFEAGGQDFLIDPNPDH